VAATRVNKNEVKPILMNTSVMHTDFIRRPYD